MKEITISTRKLNDVYTRSNTEFDLFIENTQDELSNNNTLVIVIDESILHDKKVQKKTASFTRVEDFNRWIDNQYLII